MDDLESWVAEQSGKSFASGSGSRHDVIPKTSRVSNNTYPEKMERRAHDKTYPEKMERRAHEHNHASRVSDNRYPENKERRAHEYSHDRRGRPHGAGSRGVTSSSHHLGMDTNTEAFRRRSLSEERRRPGRTHDHWRGARCLSDADHHMSTDNDDEGSQSDHRASFEHFKEAMFSRDEPTEAADTTEFYELLGVSKDATPREISKAFHKKALKCHPDRGGDEEEFMKLNAAQAVLSNPKQREIYDKWGLAGVEGGMSEDVLRAFKRKFGGGFEESMKKPPPVVKTLKVTYEDMYYGKTKTVHWKYLAGERGIKCWACNGTCMRETQTGSMASQERCNTCGGLGFNAQNVIEIPEHADIQIPRGIRDGETVKVENKGHDIANVERGDVSIVIALDEQEEFERRGADLVFKKKISLQDAHNGYAVTLKHPSGDTLVAWARKDEMVATGDLKVVKQAGLPQKKGPKAYEEDVTFGNIYVEFDVEIPKRGRMGRHSYKDKKMMKDIREKKQGRAMGKKRPRPAHLPRGAKEVELRFVPGNTMPEPTPAVAGEREQCTTQ